MLIARTAAEVRGELASARRGQRRIGLVPTMGALHDGHLSLLRRARESCDVVVMSLFVNPRQFNETADLRAYPRDEARDAALAEAAGVDVVFAPSPDAVYPPGFATTVTVAGPARGLEGAHRGPEHFDGVATVVAKLLIALGPDVAFFGEKDAQQVAVIRRLVSDLQIGCEIEVGPTIREPDGLAMSSRNALLSDSERPRAGALYAALHAVREAVAQGERDPVAATAAGRGLLDAAGARTDYLTLVDPATMALLQRVRSPAIAVVAARIGDVRLIDNLAVPVPVAHPHPDHAVATPGRAPTA